MPLKGIAGSLFIMFLYLLKDFKKCNLFICLCICLRHGMCVEVRGQREGVRSLRSSCESQRVNSGHGGWWRVPVSTLILLPCENAPLRK